MMRASFLKFYLKFAGVVANNVYFLFGKPTAMFSARELLALLRPYISAVTPRSIDSTIQSR